MTPLDRPRRLRFAPSPTGTLHLGNARTALFNWLAARQCGGQLVLRIEDTDVSREREGSEEGILQDLRWLGLNWDEGPDVGGDLGPYRQSERGALYGQAAHELLDAGHAYRCFCDESELTARREQSTAQGRAPHYSGKCRAIPPDISTRRAADGEPFAIRFAASGGDGMSVEPTVVVTDRLRGHVAFALKEIGDAIILRRDGRPTYNFAVVVDDAAMRIDLVLRGEDHLSNTPRQLLLYRALGLEPPEFLHLPMVRAADGSRLSKRHGATSVAEFREMGYPVDGLLNALALLGWAPGENRTVLDRDQLLEEFDVDRIGVAPAAYDQAKLDWICSQHLLATPGERLVAPFHRRLVSAGLMPPELPGAARPWMEELCDLIKRYVSHDLEVADRAADVFHAATSPPAPEVREVLENETARAVLAALRDVAEIASPRDVERWRKLLAEVGRVAGVKGKALFRPLRVAITGRTSGPELDLLVPLVERGHALFDGWVPPVAERARRTLEWLDTR